MTVVRNANADDINAIVTLAKAMHSESRYAVMAWSGESVRELAASLIGHPDGIALVAEHGGEIIGGVLASVSAPFFSTDRLASDFGIFVRPDWRGRRVCGELLVAYAQEAIARGAVVVEAGVSSGGPPEKAREAFESVGFIKIGELFEYRGG